VSGRTAEYFAQELQIILSDMRSHGFKLVSCCSNHMFVEDVNDDNVYADVDLR